MINIYEIRNERTRLESVHKKIEKAMEGSPAGSVYYRRRGKSGQPKPYHTVVEQGKRQKKRIPDTETELLKKLKFKTYARHMRSRVRNNLAALKQMEKYLPMDETLMSFGGEPFAECRNYFWGPPVVSDAFEALSERANPSHPESLKINTPLGVFRSKSEFFVADALHKLGLRFKYEAPLMTDRGLRYPDFTILHPKTGKLVYLEFCGMMDDPRYLQSVLDRIADYSSAGVYLGHNLHIISELPEHGLDVADLMNFIAGIFGL